MGSFAPKMSVMRSMQLPSSASRPVAESINDEVAVIGQEDGTLTLVQLSSLRSSSLNLGAMPVQIDVAGENVYVSTKPFPMEIPEGQEESTALLAINMLAAKKTGSTLHHVVQRDGEISLRRSEEGYAGFQISETGLLACHAETLGFSVLDVGLSEKERVVVDPNRSPWYSLVRLIDERIFLIQEDDRLRCFSWGGQGWKEDVSLKAGDPSSPFFSINTAPMGLFKVGGRVLCTLDGSGPLLLEFSEDGVLRSRRADQEFPIKLRGLFTIAKRLSYLSNRYALAYDGYRIALADPDLDKIVYAFSPDEADETLHIARVRGSENRLLCCCWTRCGKRPLLVIDIRTLSKPQIVAIVNAGEPASAVTLEEEALVAS